MPGHILEGTKIAVDLWTKKVLATDVKLFFLTHLHTDHIQGLTRNWKQNIYTSPVNADLLHLKGLVKPSLVKRLEVGQSHIVPISQKEVCAVTPIDANHCPGSVMFLFEGNFGTVLYTGDFRYHEDILPRRRFPAIDILYLDNTYCLNEYHFPAKWQVAKDIVKTSLNCLKSSQLLILGLDSLGKEELLVQIAKESDTKIYVDEKRAAVLKLLGLDHLITVDPSETKIHVRPTRSVSRRDLNALNKIKSTCAILPTARFGDSDSNECPNLHIFPYSCHSSFPELREFVKQVGPKKVLPIVDENCRGFAGQLVPERADMGVFDDLLCSTSAEIDYPRKRFNGLKCVQNLVFSDPNASGDAGNNMPVPTDTNRCVEQTLTERGSDIVQEVPANRKVRYKITFVEGKEPKQVYRIGAGTPSALDKIFSRTS